MLRNRLLLLISLFSSFCYGQSLQKADELFENFEFSDAGEMYNLFRAKVNLSDQQNDRLVYCLFIENKADLGLILSDSLLKQGTPNIEMWYYKSHFERELGQFENAVISAEKYLSLGGKNLPLKFRESCYINLNTPEIIDGEIETYQSNDEKANFIGYCGSSKVFFVENGLDSLGINIGVASKKGTQAEALLMKPFLEKSGKLDEWVVYGGFSNELSINSIQFDEADKKVYFAASRPSIGNPVQLVSHIYVADMQSVGSAITDFVPWKFSGLEDTSSCAHLALSSDGKTMVFSKVINGRQDGDLYFTRKENGDWSKPIQVPGINTLSQEMFPVITGDSILTFSSDGHIGYGGLDIFTIPFSSEWSHDTLIRLPKPINSVSDDFNYRPAPEGEKAFFASNRVGGKGDDDVWTFTLPKLPEPEPVVEVIDEPEPDKPEFDIDQFLKDCNSKKLYFSFNEGVTEEQFDFVDKLKELCDEGYRFSIVVTGYADARGTVPANYQVGMRRAESVRANLISLGLKSETMTSVSMGSTKIENRCKTAKIDCSEEEHRLNRYVQLTITLIE